MQQNIPTIKQIAKLLKVSVSTVSRALQDNPRISIETRQRIKQLANELGYEPNSQAISFKQKKTFVIGVVVPFIREEFFSQAISGIETVAMKNNYTILFGQSYDNYNREVEVTNAMKNRRIDGLIISLSKETQTYQHLTTFEKFGIPVIYFDRVPHIQKINKVTCNFYESTLQMVSKLYEKSARKIALINGPDKMPASLERLNGYKNGLFKKKLKIDMRMVEKSDFTTECTQQAMQNLLNLKHPPDAIITFNEYVHMDAVKYAEQKKIKVNKDILFASYANLSITKYTAHPPILSIEQHPYEQGEKAMEMMIKILQGDSSNKNSETQYYSEELPGKLIDHATKS